MESPLRLFDLGWRYQERLGYQRKQPGNFKTTVDAVHNKSEECRLMPNRQRKGVKIVGREYAFVAARRRPRYITTPKHFGSIGNCI
jgi:hypothetical protein